MVLAEGHLQAEVIAKAANGQVRVKVTSEGKVEDVLERFGVPPVPPYIQRKGDDKRIDAVDKKRYQTVYARETGAVAAPTAGLHFTPELLNALEQQGIPHVYVTLHVGPGTFKPVKTDNVEEHVMDAERYSVSDFTANAIEKTRAAGGRIVAVGSTSVRTLETVASENNGKIVPYTGRSSIFIYPPYTFKVTDMMLTNFHLPRSTLIMMISALAGREQVLKAYEEAVRERYRFYSYGDCMLIMHN